MVHYCSTESQCKDYKEKPGSCGSAAVPLLEIASKKKKTKHCIAAVKPTLVTTCLNIKANLDPDGGHARTKTVQSEARQINEIVYLDIQFLPLLFALQLKCNYQNEKNSSRNPHLSLPAPVRAVTCPYPHAL